MHTNQLDNLMFTQKTGGAESTDGNIITVRRVKLLNAPKFHYPVSNKKREKKMVQKAEKPEATRNPRVFEPRGQQLGFADKRTRSIGKEEEKGEEAGGGRRGGRILCGTQQAT